MELGAPKGVQWCWRQAGWVQGQEHCLACGGRNNLGGQRSTRSAGMKENRPSASVTTWTAKEQSSLYCSIVIVWLFFKRRTVLLGAVLRLALSLVSSCLWIKAACQGSWSPLHPVPSLSCQAGLGSRGPWGGPWAWLVVPVPLCEPLLLLGESSVWAEVVQMQKRRDVISSFCF